MQLFITSTVIFSSVTVSIIDLKCVSYLFCLSYKLLLKNKKVRHSYTLDKQIARKCSLIF